MSNISEHIVAPRAVDADIGRGVMVFDFFSGPAMHLPFNEAYLHVLRTAYPDEAITLHADAGHLDALRSKAGPLGVALRPIRPYRVPFGWSHHNPVGSRLAAAACLAQLRRELPGRARLTALLGVDAGLYALAGRHWPAKAGPLHMLLHGSLAANYVWRSRNPLIRWGDFRTALRARLRPGVRLIGLELGVPEALVDESPVLAPSVGVLEHPVLASEWSEGGGPETGPVSVGFLGFGSQRKGFDIFADVARQAAGPDVAFDAVGHVDGGLRVDTSGLRRELAPLSISRAEYLSGLRALDLVCLPLHGRSYEFAASGTVSDALAALKPVMALRNRTLQAVEDRYGPIGRLFGSPGEMAEYLRALDRTRLAAESIPWQANLRRLRQARLPEVLGQTYRAG